MAAAVALACLIAFVAGSLGQFLRLLFQQFIQCFFHAVELSLDYFLVQLYNLLGHGLLPPFRMVCGYFILPEICKPCLYFIFFQFAQFIVPYHLFSGFFTH